MSKSIEISGEPRVPLYLRNHLEGIGDNLEGFCRDLNPTDYHTTRSVLMGIAWDLKQIARRGTPSEGV